MDRGRLAAHTRAALFVTFALLAALPFIAHAVGKQSDTSKAGQGGCNTSGTNYDPNLQNPQVNKQTGKIGLIGLSCFDMTSGYKTPGKCDANEICQATNPKGKPPGQNQPAPSMPSLPSPPSEGGGGSPPPTNPQPQSESNTQSDACAQGLCTSAAASPSPDAGNADPNTLEQLDQLGQTAPVSPNDSGQNPSPDSIPVSGEDTQNIGTVPLNSQGSPETEQEPQSDQQGTGISPQDETTFSNSGESDANENGQSAPSSADDQSALSKIGSAISNGVSNAYNAVTGTLSSAYDSLFGAPATAAPEASPDSSDQSDQTNVGVDIGSPESVVYNGSFYPIETDVQSLPSEEDVTGAGISGIPASGVISEATSLLSPELTAPPNTFAPDPSAFDSGSAPVNNFATPFSPELNSIPNTNWYDPLYAVGNGQTPADWATQPSPSPTFNSEFDSSAFSPSSMPSWIYDYTSGNTFSTSQFSGPIFNETTGQWEGPDVPIRFTPENEDAAAPLSQGMPNLYAPSTVYDDQGNILQAQPNEIQMSQFSLLNLGVPPSMMNIFNGTPGNPVQPPLPLEYQPLPDFLDYAASNVNTLVYGFEQFFK